MRTHHDKIRHSDALVLEHLGERELTQHEFLQLDAFEERQ